MSRERSAAGQGPHGSVRTGEGPVASAAGSARQRPGRLRLGLQRGLVSCLVACLAFQPWLPLRAQGAAAPALPALGDPASAVLPLGEERRLGERLMQQVWRSPMYLDDPVTLAYVQSLWERLIVTARARGDVAPELDDSFAWSLFLIRDRTLNAFALPGGHVGVHLGLLAVTRSADEFAAALAHQLTHVSQRHIARGFATGQRQSALGTAALLLGLLLAARAGNPDMAQAAVAGGQAAMIQGQLNFSREMEREADRIGAAIHAQAGFSPLGTAAMFDRLEQAARLNDSGSLAYLRTHPLGSERLADARARAALLPPQPPVLTPMHALMQGRARVLMEPSAQHWQRLVSAVDSLPASAGGDARNAGATAERLADLYAAALAASGLGEHAQAHALAQALDEAATLVGAAEPAVRTAIGWLHAELAIARGDGPRALALMSSLHTPAQGQTSGPASEAEFRARPGLLLKAAAALAAARPDAVSGLVDRQQVDAPTLEALSDVRQALQVWTAEHADDALAWEWLGRCAQALGLPLLAQRARAEQLAATGDLDAAIDRLLAAQAGARGTARTDFIELSIIDVRLRQLQAQRRQWADELRRAGTPASR
jgi:predicted Zn-dependent protease